MLGEDRQSDLAPPPVDADLSGEATHGSLLVRKNVFHGGAYLRAQRVGPCLWFRHRPPRRLAEEDHRSAAQSHAHLLIALKAIGCVRPDGAGLVVRVDQSAELAFVIGGGADHGPAPDQAMAAACPDMRLVVSAARRPVLKTLHAPALHGPSRVVVLLAKSGELLLTALGDAPPP